MSDNNKPLQNSSKYISINGVMYLCYWFWTSNIKYVAEIKKKIQRKNEIINPFSDQNGLR